jgi:FMN reductase
LVALARVDALWRADGIILATPSYHGSISGSIKSTLDHTEDLRDDPRALFRRPRGQLHRLHWRSAGPAPDHRRIMLHDSRPARLADPVAAALNSATQVPPLDPQPGSKVVSRKCNGTINLLSLTTST